jgi:excisionase family DNA binding protein
MSLNEAAKLLGRSPDYLRVAANRGSLKATKIGRDWLVTTEEVERYAAENLGRRGPKRKS